MKLTTILLGFAFIQLAVCFSYYVSENGTDVEGCGGANEPCKTIAYPMSLANKNDTSKVDIFLYGGYYSGPGNVNISWPGQAFGLSAVNGTVTIDGGSSDPIIAQGPSNYPIYIQGINFVNGRNTNGGCINVNDAPYFSISDCTFDGCYAENDGGALYVLVTKNRDNIEPIGSQGTFVNNFARNQGGAIALVYQGAKTEARFSIFSSYFSSNLAVNGGALYVSGYWEITDSIFSNNTATNGGGAYMTGGDLDNCTFVGNSAVLGGGVYFSKETTMVTCTVTANKALNGGGLYATSASKYKDALYTVGNTNITNNIATDYGGGIFVSSGSVHVGYSNVKGNVLTNTNNGVGVYVEGKGTYLSLAGVLLERNIDQNNASDSSFAKNIYCVPGADCPNTCCTKPTKCSDCFGDSSSSTGRSCVEQSGKNPACIGACASCKERNAAAIAVPIIIILFLAGIVAGAIICYRRKTKYSKIDEAK